MLETCEKSKETTRTSLRATIREANSAWKERYMETGKVGLTINYTMPGYEQKLRQKIFQTMTLTNSPSRNKNSVYDFMTNR